MKEHRRAVNRWLKRCLVRNFTTQEASLCPDTGTGRTRDQRHQQQDEEALWNKFIEFVNNKSGSLILDTTGQSARVVLFFFAFNKLVISFIPQAPCISIDAMCLCCG